jgi:hypothetical protein
LLDRFTGGLSTAAEVVFFARVDTFLSFFFSSSATPSMPAALEGFVFVAKERRAKECGDAAAAAVGIWKQVNILRCCKGLDRMRQAQYTNNQTPIIRQSQCNR